MYIHIMYAAYVCIYICSYIPMSRRYQCNSACCSTLDNEPSIIVVCSTIILGILTCGTSVLFWLSYKKCCGRKKYDVEGT